MGDTKAWKEYEITGHVLSDGGTGPAAQEGRGPQKNGLHEDPARKQGLNFPFIYTHKQH